MRLLNPIIVFAICIFSTVACYADYSNLFASGGEGGLPEKLIVTDANAFLYKSFSESPVQIKPFTILWRLTDKKAKDPKNPVVVHEGKEYYAAGSPEGNLLGYVETTKVAQWTSRFVFAPTSPKGDCVFRVFNKPFTQEEFANASDSQIKNASIAKILNASAGLASFAYILNDGTADSKDRGASIDPNDFKEVLIYNTPVPGKASSIKASEPDSPVIDLNELGMDVVFVIDTTANSQPLIDMIKKTCAMLEKDVKSANKESAVIRFGLVEFRDSEVDYFGARMVCDLDEGYETFLKRLNALKAEGGGDAHNDVMLGMKLAVEQSKWSKNAVCHIILVGSSPNKATKAAGDITNFSKLYDFANKRGLFSKHFFFHSIAGIYNSDSEINEKIEYEYFEIAKNKGQYTGYYSLMRKDSTAKIAKGLPEMLSSSIQTVLEARGGRKSTSSDNKSKECKKLQGFACASTNKGEKCATLNVMILRNEMEDLENSLNQAYRRLDKLNAAKAGNVKAVVDSFLEDFFGIASGTATDEDYDKDIETVLGLQLPFNVKTLKASFKDVMRMSDKDRIAWINDLKNVRNRVKDILNQKERWIETYHEEGDDSQPFAFIPIEELQ